jgi:hypothetical protein
VNSAGEHATLPAQHVIQELCNNGMDAGDVPQLLSCLLKSNGYHHTPLYIAHGARSMEVPQYGVYRCIFMRSS